MNSKKNFQMDKNSLEKFEKKKYYKNFEFSREIPDLLDIQRKSFRDFIENGFTQILKKKNPLRFSNSTNQIQIIFFPELIQFRKPEFDVHQSLWLGKTYGSPVYIPILVQETNNSKVQLEWLLLGLLPLMTKKGHFLINGISRVVLHQMIRNPGVYTIPKDSRTGLPTIRIIPEQGSWINITLDKKNRIWFTTRVLRRKVSILIFLQALGFSTIDVYRRFQHSELFKKSYIKELEWPPKTRNDNILIRADLERHPFTQQGAWRYLYAHFQEYSPQRRDEPVTNQTSRDFFRQIIWNPKRRILGKIGRRQFQEKLGSKLSVTQIFLTREDLFLAIQALLKLVYTERLADDIDSLTNKRIQGCGEFLKYELQRGLRDFEIVVNRKSSTAPQTEITKIWRFNKTLLAKSITRSWKIFFTSGTLSQYMDQTNPLAEVTHKRRVTVLGPGGVSSKQTTIQIRGIHPTYYGRLCPIETPEGKNAGLVNSFTVFTVKDSSGNLKTPFYQVYKGQIQNRLSPFSISPQQESFHVFAPADIETTPWNVLPKTEIPVRKDWKFEYNVSTTSTTQSVGILQIISIATSLIPFLEHNDANRALMGSNMQRQAVPLMNPEAPLVKTGLETRVPSDVNHLVQALESGYVSSVTATQIKTIKPTKKTLRPSHLGTFFLGTGSTVGSFVFRERLKNQFHSFSRVSNQPNRIFGTTIFHSPNQTLPKTLSSFQSGFFSFKNSCLETCEIINFLNLYENPFQKTKKLENQPKLKTSTENVQKQVESKCEKKYSLNTYQRTNQSTCVFEKNTFFEGVWVEKNEILADGAASSGGKLSLGKTVLIGYLPWEGYNFEDAILVSQRLVDQDIFTSLHLDDYEIEVQNTQYGLETITNQLPVKLDESGQEIQKLNAKGLIEIGTWVKDGEYLVGKISPVSPKGPGIQHQYEKLYNVIMQRENSNFRNTSLRVPKGVEGFVLDVQILPPKEPDVLALTEKNSILRVRVVLLQRRKIQVGDKMAGRHGNKGVISRILPIMDMPYLPDGTPLDIVLNPLGVPSRMNVGQILECLLGLAGSYLNESYIINLFDEKFGPESSRSLVYSKLYEASIKTGNSWLFEPHHPGKIKIFDGRTGIPFEQAVTVGCAYMLKLVHLVDDKIHARATGPYSAITQQPVRGRSRNGGQRLGEMEVWALQAYGAAFLLQELLTIKSDDIDGRKETVFRIYTNTPLPFGQSESFKVLLRELQALCFNIEIHGINLKNGQSKLVPLQKLEKLI